MKIRTKLVALFLSLAMQANGLVQAQPTDEGMLEFMPSILAGINKSGFLNPNAKGGICKNPTAEIIDCGTGNSGYVENYYVVFLDERVLPTGITIEVFDSATQTQMFLSRDYCDASSIKYKTLGSYADLPDHLKTPEWLPPKGKQATYYRVTIFNGSAGEHVAKITPWCII